VYGTVNVVNKNVVVNVQFAPAYVLTIKETGLPSGAEWYGETYLSAQGLYHTSYYSTKLEANITELVAGTYTWWAFVENSNTWPFENVPYSATVTISANTTVTAHFVPIYFMHVNAVGLPSGARWSFGMVGTMGYNYSYTSTGLWINFTAPSTFYSWTAAYAGYVATPGAGNLTLSANTTLTVSFLEASTLTFTETGLPTGTAWSVMITQGTTITTLGSTTSSVVFSTVVGSYNYSVSATGYAATPASGKGTLPANATVSVKFVTATGTLGGTVTPGAATLYVDGTQQTLGSGGTYSLTLSVGVHSIEVTDSGYVTYFNNATVSLGTTTTVNIALVSIPSSTSTGVAGISTTGWVLIAVLAALAAIFLVTTVIFARRRGKQPPPVAPYSPTTPAEGAPPSGAVPAWQEPPPPPPPAGSS